MFKQMRLATKMGLGFGVLVVISGILGYASWNGLSNVTTNVHLAEEGNECLAKLNTCALLRKDFAERGFENYANENKNASDKWHEAYVDLTATLDTFKSNPALSEGDKALVQKAISGMGPYKVSFEHQEAARRMKDQAFKSWGKVGWDITNQVQTIISSVIDPGRQAAEQARDAAAITRWGNIANTLNEKVFQEFLVLRVNAVYLMATNSETQWQSYQEQLAKVENGIEAWGQLVKGESALESAAGKIGDFISSYKAAGQQYHDGMEAQQAADVEMASAAKAIVDSIDELESSLQTQMSAVAARTNTIMITMASCGIVLGVVLAVVITLSIVRPINRIISGLREGSEQVASAAGQVSSASQSLAEGATEQAAGLEETSSSLEEMSSMTKQNADNAQQANTLATEARKAANDGSESMGRMNTAIQDIQKSSDETAKIIKVIDEIAFQTNLLALNAAVEAARAGEAGKGFAVVAEEVRNLAMRSAEAAKNTASMIEESVKNSKNGVDIATEVSKVLDEIVQGVGKTTDLVGEIAAASQEQAQGIDQVNTAVAQMDKVTQQNAANAEESASASEEMNAQAESMNDIVAQLAAIVGGKNARNTGASQPEPRRLSKSDHTFHQIAAGKREHSESAPKAEKAIPLDSDNDDFAQFND